MNFELHTPYIKINNWKIKPHSNSHAHLDDLGYLLPLIIGCNKTINQKITSFTLEALLLDIPAIAYLMFIVFVLRVREC